MKTDLSLALGNDAGRRATRSAPRSTRRPAATSRQRIFLRADKTVPYGDLMEVMNLLRAAGYLKVALVGLEKTQ